MEIVGLDGKRYRFNINRHKKNTKPSKLHLRARDLLHEVFPMDRFYEEVFLPGTKTIRRNKALYADFFIPKRKILVEVQGQQHFRFNTMYHDNIFDFTSSKRRDSDKRYWCELNNILMVELPYNESDDEWRERLISAKGG